jgi:hypothetical protein
MKSPALPGVISLYVSSRGHISALTAAYEIRQILAADPRQHPTDRPVTPGSAPRTQRRTQANLRYDKRPRKTHPLTPTKQAAGSPRSGRVIRYGLRDDRRRGIDATKPQISLAVCATIHPVQGFHSLDPRDSNDSLSGQSCNEWRAANALLEGTSPRGVYEDAGRRFGVLKIVVNLWA